MQHRQALLILNLLAMAPCPAFAHAAEQGFVLLLPTDLYTGAGVFAVVLTVLVLFVAPPQVMRWLFQPIRLPWLRLRWLPLITSTVAALFLCVLVLAGLFGPRDPLANPLSLLVWTVFWIGLVSIHGLFGGVWALLSPLSGPFRLLRWLFGPWSYARLPGRLRTWPLLTGFFIFGYILLADPAPSDPARLARITAIYWASSLLLMCVFGPRWLLRGEVFTALMRAYGMIAMFRSGKLGAPGWAVVKRKTPVGVAVFSVFLLATGSFDGLNETFWWLGQLGINPLEFPGRSAVIWQTAFGLLAFNLSLILVFMGTLRMGHWLAGVQRPIADLLCRYAPTLLPIALGYHIAHYLPSFMVNSQYAVVALSDPFLTGADYLGLGEFYVTTGFFNTQESVRRIYLTQSGAIVAGHIVAVLMAHAVALHSHDTHRTALTSQAPLAVFMVAYTWFGLWLLASPRF